MKLLVIQHLEIEPAALIGEVITGAGHTLETVRIDKGEELPSNLTGYHGIVVMGGPMSASDIHLTHIAAELRLLQRAVEADFPVLGICLGAQLLARAAGAEIIASPVRELGWYSVWRTSDSAVDPLFTTLDGSGLVVFQWHGETFALPDSATLLATSVDVPHQAFRIGSSQYGLQFHIEVDETVINAWIESGGSERLELGEGGVAAIRSECPGYLPAAHAFCRDMVKAWLRLATHRERE